MPCILFSFMCLSCCSLVVTYKCFLFRFEISCKMYPGMAEEVTITQTVIMGVAPSKGHADEGFEAAAAAAAEAGAEGGGCKCGPNCTCNPCTCK
ncbi:hypothetical protein ABZP36_015197 [Zizania latifolia]